MGESCYLTMSIPNAEIAYIYKNTILTWFDKKIRKNDMTPLMNVIETGDKGIIIEVKVASKFSELDKGCDKALAQIETLQYEQELLEDGYQEIMKYGVCFFKKRCMVKLAEEKAV